MRIAFLVIAAIIIIAGCTAPAQSNQSGPSGSQPSGAAPSGGTPSGGDSPSEDDSAPPSTTNLNECMTNCNVQIGQESIAICKAACHMSIAIETNDGGKCEPILSLGENDQLTVYYDTCVISVGTATNDASLCSKAKQDMYKDSCLSTVASNKKDASVCASISDEYMKQSCIEGAK